MYTIESAKEYLKKLDPNDKFNTMIYTVAIVTKLVEPLKALPIIVGGLSVDLYTAHDYSTRDADILSYRIDEVKKVLRQLGFQNLGHQFYNDDLKIVIDALNAVYEELDGDYDKVLKINLDDDLYVYVISREDIILDRLRAFVHWKEDVSHFWAMTMLKQYINDLDINYMLNDGCKHIDERKTLEKWIEQIKEID